MLIYVLFQCDNIIAQSTSPHTDRFESIIYEILNRGSKFQNLVNSFNKSIKNANY